MKSLKSHNFTDIVYCQTSKLSTKFYKKKNFSQTKNLQKKNALQNGRFLSLYDFRACVNFK